MRMGRVRRRVGGILNELNGMMVDLRELEGLKGEEDEWRLS